MRNVLLIDTNHYAMHSYFMSREGAKKRHKERVYEMKRRLQRIDPDRQPEEFEKALDRINDPAMATECMIEAFVSAFHTRLIDKVTFEGFDGVFFARDPDSPSWRKGLYPEYKGNRDKDDLFDGAEQADRFFEAYDHEVDVLSKFIPSIWFPRFPNIEADDIIATFVKWAYEHRPAMRITIMSRDRDYLQLYKYGNVVLFDPQDRKNVECIDPEYALQTKIICGDTSDNIKNVRRGYGKVKAMAFYNQGKMDEFLSAEGARDRYNLNRQLIDFDLIPKHLTDLIDAEVDKRASTIHFEVPDIRGLHNYYIKNRLYTPSDSRFQRWYDMLKSPKFGVFTGN